MTAARRWRATCSASTRGVQHERPGRRPHRPAARVPARSRPGNRHPRQLRGECQAVRLTASGGPARRGDHDPGRGDRDARPAGVRQVQADDEHRLPHLPALRAPEPEAAACPVPDPRERNPDGTSPTAGKSRRSYGSGACAEVASCPCPQDPGFRKSRRSMGNGNCVETGNGPASVLVRDTADRSGPVLAFGPGAWKVFTGTLGRRLHGDRHDAQASRERRVHQRVRQARGHRRPGSHGLGYRSLRSVERDRAGRAQGRERDPSTTVHSFRSPDWRSVVITSAPSSTRRLTTPECRTTCRPSGASAPDWRTRERDQPGAGRASDAGADRVRGQRRAQAVIDGHGIGVARLRPAGTFVAQRGRWEAGARAVIGFAEADGRTVPAREVRGSGGRRPAAARAAQRRPLSRSCSAAPGTRRGRLRGSRDGLSGDLVAEILAEVELRTLGQHTLKPLGGTPSPAPAQEWRCSAPGGGTRDPRPRRAGRHDRLRPGRGAGVVRAGDGGCAESPRRAARRERAPERPERAPEVGDDGPREQDRHRDREGGRG